MRRFFHHLSGMMMLPVLCLLQACGGQESLIHIDVSLTEAEVSSEAGSVFVRVACEGSWTLEIVPSVDWATLGTTSGSGNKNSIILDYKSNPETASRSLTVVATAAGGKVTATATLTQQGYVAPTPSGANGGKASTAPFKWMELPATNASDGMDFLWHTIEMGGRTVRNFSYYWDYQNLVAPWVAYPLTSQYIGTSSKKYVWGVDLLLSTTEQPVLYSGYRSGNNTSLSGAFYARGHQIPKADRKVSQEASDQTCFGTNMTPQLNRSDNNTSTDFNGGIWANLESRVRSWAEKCDTLYVVTGCVLTGSQYHALDNNGKKVTVPTAYYKAVLRYAPSSSTGLGYSGFMGCAVWLEHKLYPISAKVDKTYSMSIDALEQRLGIDLFVNLPDKVGKAVADQIEAEDPQKVSLWWQ